MGFESIWVRVRADISDFRKGMAGMRSSLRSVGSQMTSAGQMMSLGLTAPIALFGVSTLKAAGNFESGMNWVQALTGATKDQFKLLNEQARMLGATTQFSATESADAMGFLAMAGNDANKILGAMPSTLNLAASAQLDMGSSADIITNVLTGMQVPIEELPHAVDVMAKAFTSSNTDLVQLGQAMKFAGPVAGSFGISLEETSAALGTLGNAGMQASMAGTGFRRILTTLVKKQDDLGISIYDSSGKMMPFVDILKQLEDQGFNSEDAMREFGDRAGPALINLLNAGSGSIRDFTETLKNSGGTAEKIANVQMQGLNGAIKELKSGFEAFQISLASSGLGKLVENLVRKFAGFFRALSNSNSKMLRTITIVLGITAAIGPLLIVLGFMISTVLPALMTGLGLLFSPITLIVGAIAGLTIAIVKNWDVIKVWAVEAINYFIGLYNESIMLRVIVETLMFYFKSFWDVVIGGAKIAWESIKGLGDLLLGIATMDMTRIGMALTYGFKGAGEEWENLVTNLKENLDDLVSNVQGKDPLEPVTTAMFEGIENFFSNLIPKMFQGGSDAGEALGEGVGEGINEGLVYATDGLNAMSLTFQKMTTDSLDPWKEKLKESAGTIANLFQTMGQGLVKGASGFKTFVSSVLGGIGQVINGLFAQAIAGMIAGESTKGLIGLATAAIGIGALTAMWASNVKLANGGLAYGPTMAMVGDNPGARSNPEVIAPLSKLQGMIGQSGPIEIYGYLEGETIYLANKEYERKIR